MKVLVAHEYYRSGAPSGEDSVYRNECELLRSNGVEVVPFECFNDDIDDRTLGSRVRLAVDAAWSERTYRTVSELVRSTRPDLAHFHNTFPVMSPSAYAACRDNGVPVVQTLHNYRLVCPGALMTRDGRPCEACIGRVPLPALVHRCYRDSLPATAAVVWMLQSNRFRGSYDRLIDRFIALTTFAAGKFAAGGLPRDRIDVRPNFLAGTADVGQGRGGYAVYVGRLSSEKGVRTLVDAWRHVRGLPLLMVGDGPLRQELEATVAKHALDVRFLGIRAHDEVLRLVGDATLQVVPSECYEGFPMTLVEAYACGTPVVASRIGSVDEIVVEGECGLKFDPKNAADLAGKVRSLCAEPDRLRSMRRRARAEFEARYTPERSFRRLVSIYQRAGAHRAANAHA